MKIAVMSDSHDNCTALASALAIAAKRGARHIIHLGDLISPFTARVFAAHYGGPLTILFGNNDGDRVALVEKFTPLGAQFHHPPATLTIDGLTIAAMHEPLFPESLAATGRFQVIMWGHTHQLEIKTCEGVLAFNPGEIHGFLSGRKTFVLLETETLETEVIEI